MCVYCCILLCVTTTHMFGALLLSIYMLHVCRVLMCMCRLALLSALAVSAATRVVIVIPICHLLPRHSPNA